MRAAEKRISPCRTMTSLLITVLLGMLVLLHGVASLSCNITNLDDEDDRDKYIATAYNGNCYIFSLEKKKLKEAWRFCRDIGGHLTDIDRDTQKFFEMFITETSKNFSEIHQPYWIGLLWSSSLDQYYWDNGANLVFEEEFRKDRFGSCVVLLDYFRWNNIGCDAKRAFICKIEPDCAQRNQNETRCAEICEDAIQKLWRNTSPHPSTPTTTAFFNTTSEAASPTTVNGDEGEDENGDNENGGGKRDGQTGTEDSEESACEKDTLQGIILPSVLGVLLAFALMTNILLICVIMCRTHKQTDQTEKSKSVPMVDILNADKTGSCLSGPLSPSDCSQLGSISELLYANDQTDGKTAQNTRKEVSFQARSVSEASDTGVEENVYNNTDKGKDNEVNVAGSGGLHYAIVNPKRGEKMKNKNEPEKHEYVRMHSNNSGNDAGPSGAYSMLNRDHGLKFDTSAMENEYGMGSASAPFLKSAPSEIAPAEEDAGLSAGTKYLKLNSGEQSADPGSLQHVYGPQSPSAPFGDVVEYQNHPNKEDASHYESYL